MINYQFFFQMSVSLYTFPEWIEGGKWSVFFLGQITPRAFIYYKRLIYTLTFYEIRMIYPLYTPSQIFASVNQFLMAKI